MNDEKRHKAKPAPWTEKHQAETRAALFRIAADLGVTGEKNRAWELAHFANSWRFDSEAEFREKLAECANDGARVVRVTLKRMRILRKVPTS